ncbi:MAG TPA: transposase [Terriglobia bacterium]|nr:transposase [Terriglobia bacterium]
MTHPGYFAPGQLQFITASTYRRVPLFCSPRFSREFVKVLETLRREFKFHLLGWVLMPEHFHLLIWPQPAESTSRLVQQLKQRTAAGILRALRTNQDKLWCVRMLARLRLPPTVHDQTSFRVWQRRFYPFGIYSEKKRLEKLDYMHANPVKRGLVSSADQWPWSSFRFYQLGDTSVLKMDRMP